MQTSIDAIILSILEDLETEIGGRLIKKTSTNGRFVYLAGFVLRLERLANGNLRLYRRNPVLNNWELIIPRLEQVDDVIEQVLRWARYRMYQYLYFQALSEGIYLGDLRDRLFLRVLNEYFDVDELKSRLTGAVISFYGDSREVVCRELAAWLRTEMLLPELATRMLAGLEDGDLTEYNNGCDMRVHHRGNMADESYWALTRKLVNNGYESEYARSPNTYARNVTVRILKTHYGCTPAAIRYLDRLEIPVRRRLVTGLTVVQLASLLMLASKADVALNEFLIQCIETQPVYQEFLVNYRYALRHQPMRERKRYEVFYGVLARDLEAVPAHQVEDWVEEIHCRALRLFAEERITLDKSLVEHGLVTLMHRYPVIFSPELRQPYKAWPCRIRESMTVHDLVFVPITSNYMLYVEGQEQSHCASQYDEHCENGTKRFFSIRRKNRRVATMHLDRNSSGRCWEYGMVKARSNGEPDKDVKRAVREFIDSYNRLDPNPVDEFGPARVLPRGLFAGRL